MSDANCHKILMMALDFDERGDKVKNLSFRLSSRMNHQQILLILGKSHTILHGSS